VFFLSDFETDQFTSDLQQLTRSHVTHRKLNWKFLQGHPFGMWGEKKPPDQAEMRSIIVHFRSHGIRSEPPTNVMNHMRLRVRFISFPALF